MVGRRLRYTNKEIERAAWLLAHLNVAATATNIPWPRLQRVLIHEGAAELIALHEAIAGEDDPALAFCRERLAWPPERLNPPPLVDGAALIAHGLTPGPNFSRLLGANPRRPAPRRNRHDCRSAGLRRSNRVGWP